MSCGKERVLEGSPLGPVPDCSLAEYLVPKMRSLPRDQVIQVDADAGAVQTVEELLGMSIGLSEGLRKIGLRENDVVGLLSRNSFESSAVVLGSWLSGAVVAPISEMKVAEMKYVLEMLKPKFFFCEENSLGAVASTVNLLSIPCTVVILDAGKSSSHPHMTFQDIQIDADINSYRPKPVSSPETQLTTILFSSGTSGLPKGVQITHRNLIFQDICLEPIFDVTYMDTCLQISRFFWITGVLMFLRSLTAGIRRVLVRETTPESLLKTIERHKTNWTLMSPSLALSMVERPLFDSFDVSTMKKIFVGGATVTSAMVDKIRGKWKTVRLVVPYGMTEVSGMISCTRPGDDLSSVGSVCAGLKVKIVDEETGKALESNSRGEICVKSPGTMKGYLGNEAATREAVDPEGWCHTGDLGYYDESGLIYIVDRIKEMIKVMNMQVAPTELENVILAIPGVSEVAVVGVTRDESAYEIMALVVKGENSGVTEEEIDARVANTLSDYKRLTAGVRFVEELPKTMTGKLRRKEIKNLARMLYSGSSG